MTTAEEIIAMLGLAPHPEEGGYFREVWRAPEVCAAEALPARYGGGRAHGTAIYYLLTPDTFSAMHRLLSDEVFHFYAGDPVEQLHLHPGGRAETVMLGADLKAGERPLMVVPRGVWQGARLAPGGRNSGGETGWALLGATVAPGFEFTDYEHGDGAALAAGWPDQAGLIAKLST